jgi:hypothetical protein
MMFLDATHPAIRLPSDGCAWALKWLYERGSNDCHDSLKMVRRRPIARARPPKVRMVGNQAEPLKWSAARAEAFGICVEQFLVQMSQRGGQMSH